MTTVSFKDRTNPAPTPIKPSFYFRYFVIAAFLIAAIGMDYWITEWHRHIWHTIYPGLVRARTVPPGAAHSIEGPNPHGPDPDDA